MDDEYMDRCRSAYPRASGDKHNGLPEPHYRYSGGGHDSVDPMSCNCGDASCPARREAYQERGLKIKAARMAKGVQSCQREESTAEGQPAG